MTDVKSAYPFSHFSRHILEVGSLVNPWLKLCGMVVTQNQPCTPDTVRELGAAQRASTGGGGWHGILRRSVSVWERADRSDEFVEAARLHEMLL